MQWRHLSRYLQQLCSYPTTSKIFPAHNECVITAEVAKSRQTIPRAHDASASPNTKATTAHDRFHFRKAQTVSPSRSNPITLPRKTSSKTLSLFLSLFAALTIQATFCDSSFCLNGVCLQIGLSRICQCDPGYIGRLCDRTKP